MARGCIHRRGIYITPYGAIRQPIAKPVKSRVPTNLCGPSQIYNSEFQHPAQTYVRLSDPNFYR